MTIGAQTPRSPHSTLEFGAPARGKVTVGPRAKARRRHRTWPWIAAVVVALVVLGLVLLVLQLSGATVDGDVDLVGAVAPPDTGPSAAD